MKAKSNWLMVVGVLGAAFLGGAFAQWTLSGREAHAMERAPKAPPKVVSARAFVLVDAAGKERGRLAVAPEGLVGLTVLDQEGKARLRMGALEEPSGWGMRAYDEAGQNRFTTALWTGDVSGMRVFDADGTKRAGLGLGPNGCGLALSNEHGVQRLGAGVGSRGGGDFTLHDWEGKPVWRASWTMRESEHPE